jgi:hypothetical protein
MTKKTKMTESAVKRIKSSTSKKVGHIPKKSFAARAEKSISKPTKKTK